MTLPALRNRRIILARRPTGPPRPTDFALYATEPPEVADGEVLLRTIWLSLAPYMRWRMSAEKSYAPPVALNDVMVGGTVSEIVQSRNDKFRTGQLVLGQAGWQEYAVSNGTGLRVIDPTLQSPTVMLGVLGLNGMTAYTGLLTIGQPKPGETVVVAAASGGVGGLVGQIAKIKGARSVGIAGGHDKCAYVRGELGFDACVDHRAEDFPAALAAACPGGIDVYFENVGGKVWEAVLPLLNDFARVPVCGVISQYNATGLPDGPDQVPAVMRAVLSRRLALRGFIVSDFADQHGRFLTDARAWFEAGRLKSREDVTEGLENAPAAFIAMLEGRNFGKSLVRVGPDAGTLTCG